MGLYYLVYNMGSIHVTKNSYFSIAIEWTEGIQIPKFFLLEDLYYITSTTILL